MELLEEEEPHRGYTGKNALVWYHLEMNYPAAVTASRSGREKCISRQAYMGAPHSANDRS